MRIIPFLLWIVDVATAMMILLLTVVVVALLERCWLLVVGVSKNTAGGAFFVTQLFVRHILSRNK